MKSRLNLKGTKQLVEKYGKSLLYVRYRYDENRGVRLKTVEIVVEEKPWKPSLRLREEEIVPVIVNFSEKDLRERLKAAGGRWDPEGMSPMALSAGQNWRIESPWISSKGKEGYSVLYEIPRTSYIGC